MRPVLFKIFGLKVYGYGTMIALGICAALILLMKTAKKKGYNEDSILNMAIITIILGVLGGKVFYILSDLKNIIHNPSILKDVGNGFVIYGAVIFGALSVIFFSVKNKWNPMKLLDMVAAPVAMAQGFGRIGCFFAGCCYGKATSLPFGVKFKEGSLGPTDVFVHPTQIYSSIFDFLLAIFLIWYAKKERKDGKVFALYIIIYSIGRFLVEIIRDDPRGNVGILSTSQFIAIFVLIAGLLIFNKDRIKKYMKE